MKYWKLVVGLGLTMLAGCANVLGVKPAEVAPSATAHVACVERGQEKCLTVDVFNFAWDPEHPLMEGLDKPYTSQEERQWRAQFMPPQLVQEYEKGSVQVSEPRTFLLYFWHIDAVSTEKLSAYRIERGKVVKVSVEDVTGSVKATWFDPVKDLGPPARVYRVHADVAGSLQIPWSMVTERTYILTCSEDRLTVSPNRVTRNDGRWVAPESLRWLRDHGFVRTTQVFLSKSATSVAGRGAK